MRSQPILKYTTGFNHTITCDIGDQIILNSEYGGASGGLALTGGTIVSSYNQKNGGTWSVRYIIEATSTTVTTYNNDGSTLMSTFIYLITFNENASIT